MNSTIKYTLFVLLTMTNSSWAADTQRVTAESLSNIAIFPESTVPATAIGMNDSKLSAEVRATVTRVPVLVGDVVKRGEKLIQLDNRDYKLNLQRAESVLKGVESRLSLAKYQLEQANSLSRENAISNEKLEQRKVEVRAVKAELETQKVVVSIAKRDLEKCTINAPFDAVIIERIAQVGELASPGSPLIRIIDATQIEVSAKVQALDISSIEKADKIEFHTQNEIFNVKLRTITPAFDPVQRNREARFIFSGPSALSGATGTIQWKQSNPFIPSSMIVRRGGKLGVFIVNNDSTAKFISIKHAQEGRPAATDLSGTTNLIMNGRFAIQDGTAVTID